MESANSARRTSNTVYITKQGNIKIDNAIDFSMSELETWWDAVTRDTDLQYKNPKTNKKIKENAQLYNRLLQQADAICLIPIDLGFAPNLSEESIDILTSLRNEIDEDDITLNTLKYIHPIDVETTMVHRNLRVRKYNQYLVRFNKRIRKEFVLQNLSDTNLKQIDSIELNSLSEDSIEKDNQIDGSCMNKFANNGKKYRKFYNKMIRTCDMYKKKVSSMSNSEISSLTSHFYDNYQFTERERIINLVSRPAIISLFSWYLMRHELTSKNSMFVLNVDFGPNNNFVTEDGIDAGGLMESMMNKIANELIDMKVFIKGPYSNKYFFNPNFKFSEEQERLIIALTFDNEISFHEDSIENTYGRFYKFIGSLLSFFLTNKFKIPFHLSTYILNNFIHKSQKIKDHDHVFYVLNDLPDITGSILNLMHESPENIDNMDMEYNDLYKIQPNKENGDKVSYENLEQYFIDLARHVNTKNILPTREIYSNVDSSYIYNNFSKGIDNSLRKIFQYKNISHNIIDQMMTSEDLSESILLELSHNISQNITFTKKNNVENEEEYNNKGMKYVEKYISYMNDLLLNRNTGFTQDQHIEFVKKLLQFWTGSNYYNSERKYKILILMEENPQGYPVSHTCFSRLDIPVYDNQSTFFKKLSFAVKESYDTFQVAGKKKARRNTSTKKSNQK